MSYEISLGLIQDRHLRQLGTLMDYSRKAFQSRPPVVAFFHSLKQVVKQEQKRRRLDDTDHYVVNWDFDPARLTSVSLICLIEFFSNKQERFTDNEPPVASFFKQVGLYLNEYRSKNLEVACEKKIRAARLQTAG